MPSPRPQPRPCLYRPPAARSHPLPIVSVSVVAPDNLVGAPRRDVICRMTFLRARRTLATSGFWKPWPAIMRAHVGSRCQAALPPGQGPDASVLQ
jgi:hypothetical protein